MQRAPAFTVSCFYSCTGTQQLLHHLQEQQQQQQQRLHVRHARTCCATGTAATHWRSSTERIAARSFMRTTQQFTAGQYVAYCCCRSVYPCTFTSSTAVT
jgi:phosphoketolase